MGRRGRLPLIGLGVAIVLLLILALDVAVWGYADRLLEAVFEPPVEARRLSVGTNVWPGYEPLYLARDLGLYGEAPIRLVELSSATQVIRAFRNGTIDVAALTLDEVLLLRESRLDARVILITDVSHGGDVILAHPEIEDMAGLRGRSIAVENTALGAFMLARALQTAAHSGIGGCCRFVSLFQRCCCSRSRWAPGGVSRPRSGRRHAAPSRRCSRSCGAI